MYNKINREVAVADYICCYVHDFLVLLLLLLRSMRPTEFSLKLIQLLLHHTECVKLSKLWT